MIPIIPSTILLAILIFLGLPYIANARRTPETIYHYTRAEFHPTITEADTPITLTIGRPVDKTTAYFAGAIWKAGHSVPRTYLFKQPVTWRRVTMHLRKSLTGSIDPTNYVRIAITTDQLGTIYHRPASRWVSAHLGTRTVNATITPAHLLHNDNK